MRDQAEILNPFSKFRAEDFGDTVWRYYVPGPFGRLLGSRPVVIEGGRGSGKTMFFLCHAWVNRVERLKAEGRSARELLDGVEVIGLYYRVDTAFVTSLDGKSLSEEQWIGIFSAYLSACLLRELHGFLAYSVREGLAEEPSIRPCLLRAAHSMGFSESDSNLIRFGEACNERLDSIENFVNAPHASEPPRPAVPGRPLKLAVEELGRTEPFAKARFHVFIDEYEYLLDYQQRVVNTLVKERAQRLFVNIGLRPNGMRTIHTLSSTEVIQPPHDFTLFRPERELVENEDAYASLLFDICATRFRENNIPAGHEGWYHDIRWYLGQYNVDLEIERLSGTGRQPGFLKRLEAAIRDASHGAQDTERAIRVLAQEAPLLNARLHLCLLLRNQRYRPTIHELMEQYAAWQRGERDEYSDWLHNTKLGLVFLLCRDVKKHKEYFGYDVYAMLSSGIIRYFLELCEQAFNFAINDGFDFMHPRILTVDEQSKAARLVSRLKIQAIEGYDPYGAALKRMVLILGEVFEALHKNPDATLGEPEWNHFSTEDTELDPELRKILMFAVMWAVLQEWEPTKEKDTEIPVKSKDFHLNHIYCPYFEISYRRKREIDIPSDALRRLVLGNLSEAKAVAREVLKRHKVAPMPPGEQTSLGGEQMSLLPG